MPAIPPKICGRVLTSSDHIQTIEEKEKKKAEEKQKKERKDQGTLYIVSHKL